MKYLPTINAWDPGISAALRLGALKLQCGQWLQCGPGPKSRYVRTCLGGSIWAIHYPFHCDYERMKVLNQSK